KTTRFTTALGPAAISSADPITGMNAPIPGKAPPGDSTRKEATIQLSPTRLAICLDASPASLSVFEPRNKRVFKASNACTKERFGYWIKYASSPPTPSSQNLERGE